MAKRIFHETPVVVYYLLAMTDCCGTVQEWKLTIREYNALKTRLAEIRGANFKGSSTELKKHARAASTGLS
jgi:hypothetical protein